MERADKPRPGPGRILGTGLRFTLGNMSALVRAGTLYFVLIVVLWTAGDFIPIPEIAIQLAYTFAIAYFSWDWHRAYLFGTDTVSWRGSFVSSGDKEAQKETAKAQRGFAWRAVGLCLILGVVAAVLTIPLFVSAGVTENDIMIFILFIVLPVLALLAFPVARILPSFAAHAIQKPVTWKTAWSLSKGAGFRFGFALIMLGALTVFILALLTMPLVTADMPAVAMNIGLNIVIAIASLLFAAIGSVCNAFVFTELTGWQGDQVSEADVFD